MLTKMGREEKKVQASEGAVMLPAWLASSCAVTGVGAAAGFLPKPKSERGLGVAIEN